MRRPTNGPGLPGSPESTAIFAPLGMLGGASPHLSSDEFMYMPLSAARAGAARANDTAKGIKALRMTFLLVVGDGAGAGYAHPAYDAGDGPGDRPADSAARSARRAARAARLPRRGAAQSPPDHSPRGLRGGCRRSLAGEAALDHGALAHPQGAAGRARQVPEAHADQAPLAAHGQGDPHERGSGLEVAAAGFGADVPAAGPARIRAYLRARGRRRDRALARGGGRLGARRRRGHDAR